MFPTEDKWRWSGVAFAYLRFWFLTEYLNSRWFKLEETCFTRITSCELRPEDESVFPNTCKQNRLQFFRSFAFRRPQLPPRSSSEFRLSEIAESGYQTLVFSRILVKLEEGHELYSWLLGLICASEDKWGLIVVNVAGINSRCRCSGQCHPLPSVRHGSTPAWVLGRWRRPSGLSSNCAFPCLSLFYYSHKKISNYISMCYRWKASMTRIE